MGVHHSKKKQVRFKKRLTDSPDSSHSHDEITSNDVTLPDTNLVTRGVQNATVQEIAAKLCFKYNKLLRDRGTLSKPRIDQSHNIVFPSDRQNEMANRHNPFDAPDTEIVHLQNWQNTQLENIEQRICNIRQKINSVMKRKSTRQTFSVLSCSTQTSDIQCNSNFGVFPFIERSDSPNSKHLYKCSSSQNENFCSSLHRQKDENDNLSQDIIPVHVFNSQPSDCDGEISRTFLDRHKGSSQHKSSSLSLISSLTEFRNVLSALLFSLFLPILIIGFIARLLNFNKRTTKSSR